MLNGVDVVWLLIFNRAYFHVGGEGGWQSRRELFSHVVSSHVGNGQAPPEGICCGKATMGSPASTSIIK